LSIPRAPLLSQVGSTAAHSQASKSTVSVIRSEGAVLVLLDQHSVLHGFHPCKAIEG
jgi:hypothetical protein